MDDTEPAAATNSAVFGENISEIRLEPNDLTPRAESKSWPWPRIASFEAQVMGRCERGSRKRKASKNGTCPRATSLIGTAPPLNIAVADHGAVLGTICRPLAKPQQTTRLQKTTQPLKPPKMIPKFPRVSTPPPRLRRSSPILNHYRWLHHHHHRRRHSPRPQAIHRRTHMRARDPAMSSSTHSADTQCQYLPSSSVRTERYWHPAVLSLPLFSPPVGVVGHIRTITDARCPISRR